MPADMSFSTNASPDFLVDDGLADPDDYSSVSSDDIHIGISTRPQLPHVLSANVLSKTLSPRLTGGIVSPAPSSPRRCSQSAYRNSPLPHAVLQPTRPTSDTPPRAPPDSRGRRRGSLAQSQNDYDERRDSNNRTSFVSPSKEHDGAEADETSHEVNHEPAAALRLAEHYARLRNQRAYVRKLRQSKDEVDREFMAAAQALIADNPQLSQLHKLFKNMHDIRLVHQAAESHLEEITDELQHFQADPDSAGSFYATTTGPSGTALFKVKDRDNRPDNSDKIAALWGITGDRPQNSHALYEKKLREALGELQLAKELLANTQMKREAFQAQKSLPLAEDTLGMLEAYGDAGRKKALELRAMALMTEDDYEQLREYDELEQSAKRDIETYTNRISLLEQECRENGVSLPSSYFPQRAHGPDSREEIRLAPVPFDGKDESATLAHPVFPLLLSNPTHLFHEFPQTALQSLRMAIQLPPNSPVRAKQVSEAALEANMDSLLSTVESDDKSEFINRWLLHKLHSSAMEAELLWTTVRARLKILDIDRWQRHVLHFWWRDDPVDPVPAGIGNNGTDKTAPYADPGAEFNRLPYSDSGQLDGLRHWKLDDSWL
ncbi:hypothetical protein F4861DRAFT_513001 [Xylaria intraflava]|nr:hypothetical protein F4861DRAFT_513001 [Xylaria intraflava]